MLVRPLTDAAELRRGFEQLVTRVASGAQTVQSTLAWPGGSRESAVYWRSADDLWARLAPQDAEDRYDCAYGIGDPRAARQDIVCKTSIPFAGVNRRLEGALVRDDDGVLYLAHTGRFTVSGVAGNTRFLDWYDDGRRAMVPWPKGGLSEMLLVAQLDDPNLPAGLSTWVHAVARFKRQNAAG